MSESLVAEKTRVFMGIGLKPDVMWSMLDSEDSLETCIEVILDRSSRGEILSRKISCKLDEGYSVSDVRMAVVELVEGVCSTFDEAFVD